MFLDLYCALRRNFTLGLVYSGQNPPVSGGAVKRAATRKNTPAKFFRIKNGETTMKIFLKTKRPHMQFKMNYKNPWLVLAEKLAEKQEQKNAKTLKSSVWCGLEIFYRTCT